LLGVPEAAGHNPVKNIFTGMTKRGVPEIMSKSDRLRQLFIQQERFCDSAGDLGNLKGMGQPRSVVVARRRQKYLGFMFEPPECF